MEIGNTVVRTSSTSYEVWFCHASPMQLGVRFGPFGRPLGFRQTEFVIPGHLYRFASLVTTYDKKLNIKYNISITELSTVENDIQKES